MVKQLLTVKDYKFITKFMKQNKIKQGYGNNNFLQIFLNEYKNEAYEK